MINTTSGVIETSRFYQDASRTGSPSGDSSRFAAHLLSSRSLFSPGLGGASGSAPFFENRMFKILGEIARHIQNKGVIPPQFPVLANRAPLPTLPAINSTNWTPTLSAEDGLPKKTDLLPPQPLGALSARFESGDLGVEAIGYDQQGGTSYGKYQISSRAGSMERFIRFLENKAPEWASRLEAAGPANTGSRDGEMPAAWKAIAAEDPVKFGNLQHAFIRRDYYMPARDMILEQTGFDFDKAPVALQEVLWSTAVQHGPTGATRIFSKAADRFLAAADISNNPRELIEKIFAVRSRQFDSSGTQVQNAVKSRFTEEKQLAFGMLNQVNAG